ncbi:MAG TPA: hypothetical protein VK140_15695 [Ktedonobacteraceae bacterium]|nr:hypothetical protein [Ktedonobacteraceae bacterium]
MFFISNSFITRALDAGLIDYSSFLWAATQLLDVSWLAKAFI